jgi:hypothetical protein
VQEVGELGADAAGQRGQSDPWEIIGQRLTLARIVCEGLANQRDQRLIAEDLPPGQVGDRVELFRSIAESRG